MLDKFQHAILSEMGITVFAEQSEQPSSHPSTNNTKSVPSVDKIQDLRASLGVSGSIQQKPTTDIIDSQPLVNPDPRLIADLSIALESLNLTVPPTEKWQVLIGKPLDYASDNLIFPHQLKSLSSEQKKQLWKQLYALEISIENKNQ